MKTTAKLTLLSCCLLVSGMATAQKSKSFKRQQWEIDLSYTGIGTNFNKPALGKNFEYPKPWRSIDIQLGPLIGGYSQGMAQAYFVENEFISEERTLSDALASRSYYLGYSLPFSLLTFGEFRSYKEVFRGHPIWQTTFGGMRMGPRRGSLGSEHNSWQFALTPGYRIRFPYASVDIGLENRFNFVRDGYMQEAKTYVFNPKVTIRLDGLFDSFNAYYEKVDAVAVSATQTGSTSSTSTTRNADGSRTITTRTTTHYNVTSTPTSFTFADIGPYAGIGIRASHSTIGVSRYSNAGTLVGINGLLRGGPIVGGINIEGGRIGHASLMDSTDPNDKKHRLRKPNKGVNNASGSLFTVNTMLDLGLDVNRHLLALLGLITDESNATSYLTFNAGYSSGFSFISGQRFDDQDVAVAHLERAKELNRYNDGRESKSGYVGGWFMACDVGNVSFKTQWYRYKKAPLANGLMMSAAYRFGGGMLSK